MSKFAFYRLIVRGLISVCLCWAQLAVPAWAESVEPSSQAPKAENLPAPGLVARQELQNLVDEGVRQLVPELSASSTFYPFAVVLGHDGLMRVMGVPAKERDESADSIVKRLVSKAQNLAETRRIKAVAFFMDYVAVREDTGLKQPGIRIELNHQLPDTLSVFVPYLRSDSGKIQLLTTQYSKGKNLIFIN